MKTSRTMPFVGVALLLALLAPAGADARPPEAAGPVAPEPSVSAPLPSIAGAHLVISQLTSAPTHARAGHSYVIRGAVVNEGGSALAAASSSISSASATGRSRSAQRASASRRTTPAASALASACHARSAAARTRSSRACGARDEAARSDA
jgi:hypothetical protein